MAHLRRGRLSPPVLGPYTGDRRFHTVPTRGLGDGDLDCGALASHLEDRFTCFLASTRNRGLSGSSDDLGGQRHDAEHVPNAEIREVPGSGHSGMVANPRETADALNGFFTTALAGIARD